MSITALRFIPSCPAPELLLTGRTASDKLHIFRKDNINISYDIEITKHPDSILLCSRLDKQRLPLHKRHPVYPADKSSPTGQDTVSELSPEAFYLLSAPQKETMTGYLLHQSSESLASLPSFCHMLGQ